MRKRISGIIGLALCAVFLVVAFQNCSRPADAESTKVMSYDLDQGDGQAIAALEKTNKDATVSVVKIKVGDLAKRQPVKIKLDLASNELITALIAELDNTRSGVADKFRRTLDSNSWDYDDEASLLTVTSSFVNENTVLYIALKREPDIQCVRAPCRPRDSSRPGGKLELDRVNNKHRNKK